MNSGDYKHNIGKMEIWEPEDKSFSKHAFKEGIGDITPNDGAVCTVSITFLDEDVEIPDEELGDYQANLFKEITIGEGDTKLSELLDKVVCNMKENEHSYIKSKVDAKGNKLEDSIKPQGLKFNVFLKSFNRAADVDELENDEKLEKAQHHKDKGTELFKAGKLDYAIKRYVKAVSFLEKMQCISDLPESLKSQCTTLQVQCYSNLGQCYLNMEKYDDVINITGKALEVDGQNVKALFRRGQACGKLHKYEEAVENYELALKYEPTNNAVKNQLKRIEELAKKEKEMYQKMFK